MTLTYADTSALARAYLPDEPEHGALRAALFESGKALVTSEVTRVEFRSAIFLAWRRGRLADPDDYVVRFDLECANDGALELIALDPQPVLGLAAQLVERHPLRTLDAIHLAVAIEESAFVAPDDDLVFVTRDDRQRDAARAEGLAVA